VPDGDAMTEEKQEVSLICMNCDRALEVPGIPDQRAVSFTCEGCGGAGYGARAVPKLNDLQRQKAKNAQAAMVAELVSKKE